MKIKLLEKEKVLYIKFYGTLTDIEAAIAFVDFKKQLHYVNREYVIITDIRDLKDVSFEARLLLEKSFKLIDQIKPAKLVRIVNDINEHTIFDKAHENLEVTYSVEKSTLESYRDFFSLVEPTDP